MKTLLLTGFAPWDHYERNAACELLREQAASGPRGWRIRTLEVPVSWQRAWPTVAAFWDEDVRAVVAFGQAEDDAVRIERFAVNGSNPCAVDVDGARFDGEWNVAEGPMALHTGLPWQRLVNALSVAGLPVRSSLSAGDYLCNHLAYRVLHYQQIRHEQTRQGDEQTWKQAVELRSRVMAGFVHVPTLSRMGLADLNQVREIVVNEVIDHLEGAADAPWRAHA